MVRYFLDTGIFIASFDNTDPKKQDRAQALIGAALNNHIGIISHQVVEEFLEWALHRFEQPLSLPDAREYLKNVLMPLNEVTPDTEVIRSSLDIMGQTGYPIRDASILAAAMKGRCQILYSNRFERTKRMGNISLRDPFAEL